MYKPDYQGNSIVNLVASITQSCGGRPIHPPLRDHDTSAWGESQHLVLLVLDGLGWDVLSDYGADSFLARHLRRRMTSVFPSTTAAALTTFLSGLTPLEHAMTGWFVWLKELGSASAILPFVPRWEWRAFDVGGIDYRDIYSFPPLLPQIPRDCAVVSPAAYTGSAYTTHTSASARNYAYATLDDFIDQIKCAVQEASGPSFTYAYWPKYDSICHQCGKNSDEAEQQLATLDSAIERLAQELAGSGAHLLATADHGFCGSTPETRLRVEDYPDIVTCLNIPLCGEPRVPYAYVKPAQAQRFESLVREKLGHCCTLLTRQQTLDGGWYGVGEPHPDWADRVGDYILLMHDGWVLTQAVLGEGPLDLIGFHGGPSEHEMHVPLVEITM